MSLTIVGVIVIVVGLCASTPGLITWLVCFLLLGATAAANLPALGGASVLPSSLIIPFVVFRAWKEHSIDLGRIKKADFWLWTLLAWALLAAVLLPRVFQGETMIMTVDRSTGYKGVVMLPARPSSGNVTQSVYLAGGVALFSAVRSLLCTKARQLRFASAVLLVGSLNGLAALINLAEYYLHIPSLLAPLRTASYSSFDNAVVGGLVRIQGTFPEASTFAGFTMPLFAFSTQLWLAKVRPHLSGTVAALSLALLVLSTSSTAYAGVAIYLAFLGLSLARQAFMRGADRHSILLLFSCLAIPLAIWLTMALLPGLSASVVSMADQMVLKKLESSSGQERAALNWRALQTFLETYGVGVGTGSTRASSYPLSVLSNLGIPGALVLGAFLYQVLQVPPAGRAGLNHQTHAINAGARHALIISLIALLLAGTVIYPGESFFVYAAAAASSSAAHQPQQRRRRLPGTQTTLTKVRGPLLTGPTS